MMLRRYVPVRGFGSGGQSLSENRWDSFVNGSVWTLESCIESKLLDAGALEYSRLHFL